MEIKEEAFCHVDAYKLFHDGVKLQVRKKGWPNLKWQDSVIAEMFGWGDISYYEFRRKPIELEDGAWYPVVAVSSGQRHVARFNGNKELFESGLLSFEVDNFKIGEQLEINWPE